MVRYRAYSTKGMTAAQVAILVALCSFTFFLGTIILGGFVLMFQPQQLARLEGLLPSILTQEAAARTVGGLALGLCGDLRHRIAVATAAAEDRPVPRRLSAAERHGAPIRGRADGAGRRRRASSISRCPRSGNPGFITVLAVFLASFSAGLVSNAPGGLGVFELVFITALPSLDKHQILAALIVFRLFYLLIPLVGDCSWYSSSSADGWSKRCAAAKPTPPAA